MNKALRYLILIGLVVWGFLMYESSHPNLNFGGTISDANTDTRCDKFKKDVEGEQILSYGDRFAQFAQGCW